jgi:hypothetical protein
MMRYALQYINERILLLKPAIRLYLVMSVLSFYLFSTSASAQKIDSTFYLNFPDLGTESANAIDTSGLSIILKPPGTYSDALQFVESHRKHLKKIAGNTSSDSLYTTGRNLLEECIINKVIPFWYGTAWDFNGYTNTPGTGTIACGYFVSTVLKHCGFRLNRYRLARQSPILEAVSLQMNDSIMEYINGYHDFVKRFKEDFGQGLYFVGLECHAGFLLYRKNSLIFIHSSYVPPLCVVAEEVNTSAAFTISQIS